ncbi:hypothetical protein, partial [Kitasatospora herbaricolor]|uniref:hypothetical protein n=1 Tax=Kitasatospora herbaricolor TaxID=68217 RepID=UPI0036DD6685
MKKAALWAGVGAIAFVAVAGLGLGAANATTSPAGASDATLVAPGAQANGTSYYTDAQIDQVWATVTANYPEPLPAGVSFP